MWEMVRGISKVPVQRRWAISGDSGEGEARAGRAILGGRKVTLLSGWGNLAGEGCLGKGGGGLLGRGLVWRLLM